MITGIIELAREAKRRGIPVFYQNFEEGITGFIPPTKIIAREYIVATVYAHKAGAVAVEAWPLMNRLPGRGYISHRHGQFVQVTKG